MTRLRSTASSGLAVLMAMSRVLGGTPVRSVVDLQVLKDQAHRSKRLVLLLITSSDPNCWQCQKIARDFFGNSEFTRWVDRYAVGIAR